MTLLNYEKFLSRSLVLQLEVLTMTPNTTSASDNKHLLWCMLAVCQKDFEEQDTKLSLAFLDDGGAFIGKR